MIKKLAKTIRYCILYIKYFQRFKNVGKHTVMFKPLRIMGGKNITIGDYTYILQGLRIETIDSFNNQKFTIYKQIYL